MTGGALTGGALTGGALTGGALTKPEPIPCRLSSFEIFFTLVPPNAELASNPTIITPDRATLARTDLFMSVSFLLEREGRLALQLGRAKKCFKYGQRTGHSIPERPHEQHQAAHLDDTLMKSTAAAPPVADAGDFKLGGVGLLIDAAQ
jgi:hypothetical protein